MHNHCYKGKQSARVCLRFWRFKAGSRNLVYVVVQASPCSVIQTVFLKLKRAEEGGYVCVCLYVSVCIGVYVSVVYVWVWCIHKHTGLLAYACTEVKRGHFNLSLSVLIPMRQKLVWWPPGPRDLLCLPLTALGFQAYMWPHLTSGSSDTQMVGSHICIASALTHWANFLAQTWTFQVLPYSI